MSSIQVVGLFFSGLGIYGVYKYLMGYQLVWTGVRNGDRLVKSGSYIERLPFFIGSLISLICGGVILLAGLR